MKKTNISRRALSMVLASAMTLSLVVFTPPKAEALRVQPGQDMTTTTNIVIWDWIDDMQSIGTDADVANPEAKYSRIMFYQSVGGDRYYFNAAPDGGNKSGDYYTTYHEDKIYLDSASRVGNSVHKEWNQDLIDGDHFITVGGQRTPYIQYAGEKEGYKTWRFWVANKDDSLSDFNLMLVDDYEDLDLRRTSGGYGDPHSNYGAKNDRIRSDGWTIAKTAHIVPQSRWATYDNHVIWHWDNDTGGYDEALEFDLSDRKFRAWNIDTGGCDEFGIYLGAEHAVPTLNANFTVNRDQITTLGRPLFYIPKGVTITVKNEGILSVDGMLLNDGEIIVEDGGLLVLKDGAKIMPLTKYDNDCGKISSKGSVVVEENALLCGGAVNGIRILGGGVVNYGIIAAEDFYISENYAIENRGDGWVFAGQSPTRAARLRYIMEAIANEGVTTTADPRADFGKIGNVKSTYNIPANGIYGSAAANVVKSGEKAVGSADDPTLSVYTRDTPNDAYEKVFEDVKLDKVDTRVEKDKVVYTADGETYTIKNKLVSAAIGRGDKNRETIFKDMWVGSLDGAYVQLEPACAPGKQLAIKGGTAKNNANVLIYEANGDKDKFWHLKKSGSLGAYTTYYINSGTQASDNIGLDLPGIDTASAGANVSTYANDEGADQKWFFVPVGGTASGYYYIRNAANSGLSLDVQGGGSANDTNVQVYTSNNSLAQRWRFANLMDEDAYGSAITQGTALEFTPQNATGLRLTLGSLVSSFNLDWAVSLQPSAEGGTDQRWQLESVGTDDLDGEVTPYYRIIEVRDDSALALEATDTTQDGKEVHASVSANKPGQYWYLQDAGGSDTYYLASRANSGMVLTAGGSSSGSKLTLSQNRMTEAQKWQARGLSSVKDAAERDANEAQSDSLNGKTLVLKPKIAENMAAWVKGDVKSYGSPVQLGTASDSNPFVLWTAKIVGYDTENDIKKPYYIFTSVGSTYVMGVNVATSGAFVSNCRETETVFHPYWYIEDGGDGYYTISLRDKKEICLTVRNSETAVGTSLQTQTDEGGDHQRWKLEVVETSAGGESVDLDGRVFYISPKHTGSDKVLDLVGNGSGNGTQVQLYDKKETEIQRWRFEKLGSDYVDGKKTDYYAIHSVYASGKALDTSGSTGNGARPHLWDYGASNKNQQWYLQDAGGGYYYIIPRSDTTKYLGVAGSSTSNNAAVELWSSSGDNRQWKLTETIVPETLGTYSILPKHAPGMHVGPTSSDSNNGTKLIIWEYNESSNYARWTFVKMGTDSGGAYYKIVNMANGKVIDAVGNNTIQADSQLQQWDSDFNNDQLWYLNDAGQDENGFQYYNIVNRCDTNYCMAVSNGSTAHGTGVTVSMKNGGDSQKFRLMERFEPVDLGTYEFGNPTAVNMRLTVNGASKSDGANILLYLRHTTNANGLLAQFKIIQRGNDMIDGVKTPYYSIENVNSGKVLDPPGAGTVSSAANVQQYTYDGYSDQHWYMNVLEDNTVVFRNRANSKLVLETAGTTNDSNVRLGTYSDSNPNQRWQLHPVMVTETVAASKGSENSVQYYIPGNQAAADAGIPFASAENYYLNPAVGGKYTLTPQHATGLRMDLYGADTSNGKTICAHTNNGSDAQRWQFIPMGVDYFDGDGRIYYKIAYGSNANKVVQTTGNATVTASLNVGIWDDEGCYDDQWYLEQAATGSGSDNVYYIIGRGTMGEANKICLGVPSGATASGTQLQTATLRNKNYQQWELEQVD